MMVRSPHAHARIASVDKAAALAAPGVLAVLTGADYVADGLGAIPHNAGLMAAPDVAVRVRGSAPIATHDYPMPPDKARFVGEPVAIVVAATVEQAKDAAELLDIAYEPLAAVTRAAEAIEPGAPRLWDEAPGNLCIDIEVGDEAATATRPSRAPPMSCGSTPGCSASPACRWSRAPSSPNTTRRAGTTRSIPAAGAGSPSCALDLAQILGVPAEQVRVLCGDMGGNFGTRNFFYPEYAVLAWAARQVGRPVKWTGERSESFLSDYQGRDLTVEAELALDEAGNFLAVRGSNLSNLGGHAAAFVSLQKGLGLMSSVYHIPVGYFRGRGAVTNTVSTTPYRSAGRPEAIFVVERLIDLAADQLGLDPVELRRRNMIPPRAQPYANPFGLTYDSGRYEEAMEPGPGARRLARLCRASRRGRATRQATRHRHRQLCRDHQRRAARAHRDHRQARRPGRAGDGHDVVRPRPRDQLRPARHRMARRAVREHRLRRPRHRSGSRPAAARIRAAR